MIIDFGPQPSGRLCRAIYIRQHGDGFTVTVEPYPAIPSDCDSLNRRFEDYGAARGFAVGTEQRKGWPVIDEAQAARRAHHSDPKRRGSAPRVVVEETGRGTWLVSVRPRPWGWQRGDAEFFGYAKAERHADGLRRKLQGEQRRDRKLRRY